MKRGLKLVQDKMIELAWYVEESSPMKRGLKPRSGGGLLRQQRR